VLHSSHYAELLWNLKPRGRISKSCALGTCICSSNKTLTCTKAKIDGQIFPLNWVWALEETLLT
jgi:hypothetical protein